MVAEQGADLVTGKSAPGPIVRYSHGQPIGIGVVSDDEISAESFPEFEPARRATHEDQATGAADHDAPPEVDVARHDDREGARQLHAQRALAGGDPQVARENPDPVLRNLRTPGANL